MMNWPITVGVALFTLGGLTNTSAAAECSDAPVKTLNAGLLAAMTQGNTSTFASRQAALTPVLAEAFDLRVISRLVLGKVHADLDEAQRAAFTDAFSEMVYATYASRFKQASGVAFKIREVREQRRSRCAVLSAIERPEKDPVRLNYLVHQREGAWRIINVVAEGVSDLALKRAEYGAVIKREGFEVLLAKLRAQTQRLGEG
jgi:phospholipid transport system substrate-binding protein